MRIRELLVGLFVLFPLAALAAPRVGGPAPDFVFWGEDGASYRLADYIGKQAAVIAWFPKAFTSG
ncbi:MAG: hypothetical protein GY910_04545 [bacterium]|nr:hypothetical protein [Deltaproteobacteria bacterium]MCP4904229.1 hypothetical protein [bacterium]